MILNMFVLSFLVNFLMLSIAKAESGSVFVNRPVLPTDNNEKWYNEPTGHVRCFCNLPTCVTAGYMCKSTSGGCFSNLLRQPSTYTAYKGLHGCLELLTDKEQRDWCKVNPNSQTGRKKKHHPRSLLYCCYSDMCNHVDNPETTNLIDESVNIFNETQVGKPSKNSSSRHINAITYNSSDIWFKAATIAVPICGAVIVLVLVVLAVKLLRTESSIHTRHKLGSTYIPTQSKNNCEKYDESYKKSHHSVHNDTIPTHHNSVYYNHVEELQQIRTPLLVQNELGHNATNKNTNTSTKYVPQRSFNQSLGEIDSHNFNTTSRSPNCEYSRGNLPEVHKKNVFCDVAVSKSLVKCIPYDKANLTDCDGDEDDEEENRLK